MHFYAQGRHGFGLRRTTFPVAWPGLAETWLVTIGMISEQVANLSSP